MKALFRIGLLSCILLSLVNSKALAQNAENSSEDGDWKFQTAKPIWSPDGKKIAFVSIKETSQRICVIDADGKNLTEVPNTESALNWKEFCWSPDSKKIAFIRSSQKAPLINALCIVGVDGNDLKVLTDPKVSCQYISWAPKGDDIAFVKFVTPTNQAVKVNNEIWVANSNDGTSYALADGDLPSWSPDGKQIAFLTKKDRGPNAINIINVADKKQHSYIPKDSRETWITDLSDKVRIQWSPDGSKLFFPGRSNSTLSILTKDVPNREATIYGDGDPSLRLSPDGKIIIVVLESALYSIDLTRVRPFRNPQEAISGKIAGECKTSLRIVNNLTTNTDDSETDPCWSPDGKQIVFMRGYEVMVMSLADSKRSQLFERSKLIQIEKQKASGKTIASTNTPEAVVKK